MIRASTTISIRLCPSLCACSAVFLGLLLGVAPAAETPATAPSQVPLDSRMEVVQDRLQKVSESLTALDTNFHRLTDRASLDVASLKVEAQSLADEQAAKQGALANLQNQLQLLLKARQTKQSNSNASSPELQHQVREAQQELERLAQEEARLQAQAGNQSATTSLGRTKILDKSMWPLNVAFIKSRVLPVRAPYYQTILNFGSSSPIHLVPRPGAGELIGQATRLGGCLDLYLKDFSPKTNYFHFWVSPDSISAFHVALQFALTNKYAYTWSTYNGGSFFPAGHDASVRGAGGGL